MTTEDKELLLKDLCARLPYGDGVRIKIGEYSDYTLYGIMPYSKNPVLVKLIVNEIEHIIEVTPNDIKPYLRPMSSMTEEEKRDYQAFFNYDGVEYPEEYIDWLNKNMFDYRGLIEKGLAIEALE